MRPELTLANSKVGDQFGPSSSPSLSFILFSRVVLPSDLLCRPVWPWISNPSASWVLRLWDGRPVPLNVFRLGMEARALCMGGKHYANKLHPLTFVLYRDILNIYLTSDYMYTIFILLLIKCIGMCLHVGLCKWMWCQGGPEEGVGVPGAGVIGSRTWQRGTSLLEDWQTLLTTRHSLQMIL